VKAKQGSRRIGLARALSKLGYCSRSRAALLVREGRVRLNGKVCRDPETPVQGARSLIAVDNELVEARDKIYLMLNKPRGVVTTASDEKGRKTVYGVLNGLAAVGADGSQHSLPWVFPVGRLDKASEGLLLLTNDSEWGARISAPETHLDKTYHVQIGTIADEKFIRVLLGGVKSKEEEVLRVKQVRPIRTGEKNCWLEIVLDEGKNRQIRRIMEALGIEVLRLVRVAIGPLHLSNLAKGQFRPLRPAEKRMLDRAMSGENS
jgi:23S rRNA pseudouridine2605 synthase